MKHVLGNPEVIKSHFDTPILPAYISVVPLGAVWNNVVRRYSLLLILAVLLIGSMFIYVLSYAEGGNEFNAGDIVFLSLWLAAALVAVKICKQEGAVSKRQVQADLADCIDYELLKILGKADMTVSGGFLRLHRAVWPKLESGFEKKNRSCPRTVLDWSYLEPIQSIDLPKDLEEPEHLVGSVIISRIAIFFLAIAFAFITLIAIPIGGIFTVCSLVPAVLLCLILITRPKIRNQIPGLRRESRGLLAGPGFVRDRQDRIWKAGQAMMLVRPAAGKIGVKQPVQAIIFGAQGAVALNFNSINEPDFKRLWRFWNHQTPRPELADSGI